jgi:hypothetical protein
MRRRAGWVGAAPWLTLHHLPLRAGSWVAGPFPMPVHTPSCAALVFAHLPTLCADATCPRAPPAGTTLNQCRLSFIPFLQPHVPNA